MYRKVSGRSGQALLVVVLLATVLLTIGISISQISKQETKVAKLEEESKKAFSAAEAGVEEALRVPSGTVLLPTLQLGSEITGQAVIEYLTIPNSYQTPIIKKDEQYTFYLSSYTPADPDAGTPQSFGPKFSDNIKIQRLEPASSNYCSDDPGGGFPYRFAVELSFIDAAANPPTIVHKLIDECDIIEPPGPGPDEYRFGDTIDLASFPSNILIMKIIAPSSNFPGAKLAVDNLSSGGASCPTNTAWCAQGKTITSTANTAAGVTKKIQLFQSFPQIPADFFGTSF